MGTLSYTMLRLAFLIFNYYEKWRKSLIFFFLATFSRDLRCDINRSRWWSWYSTLPRYFFIYYYSQSSLFGTTLSVRTILAAAAKSVTIEGTWEKKVINNPSVGKGPTRYFKVFLGTVNVIFGVARSCARLFVVLR